MNNSQTITESSVNGLRSKALLFTPEWNQSKRNIDKMKMHQIDVNVCMTVSGSASNLDGKWMRS